MRVFVAVAEARGFAAGARNLAMSAPAVTRAIAALEERVGAPLLRRTTRVVKLTDAGARFLADCKRILADVDDAESAVAGSHAALRGPLVITAPVLFGRLFVAPIVLEFLDANPSVNARVLFADRVVDLLDDNIDVAIRIAHLSPLASFVAARVGTVRRVTVASPAFLQKHGTPKTPADLEPLDAIAFAHGPSAPDWSFANGDATLSVRPRIRLITSSTDVSVSAAVAGCGVTRALSYQVASDVRAGRLVVVLRDYEPPPLPVHVVHRDGHRGSARVRAFVTLAVRRLRASDELTDLSPPP